MTTARLPKARGGDSLLALCRHGRVRTGNARSERFLCSAARQKDWHVCGTDAGVRSVHAQRVARLSRTSLSVAGNRRVDGFASPCETGKGTLPPPLATQSRLRALLYFYRTRLLLTPISRCVSCTPTRVKRPNTTKQRRRTRLSRQSSQPELGFTRSTTSPPWQSCLYP